MISATKTWANRKLSYGVVGDAKGFEVSVTTLKNRIRSDFLRSGLGAYDDDEDWTMGLLVSSDCDLRRGKFRSEHARLRMKKMAGTK